MKSNVHRGGPSGGRSGRAIAASLVLVLAGLAATAAAADAEVRTWTDSTGQFTIEARFVALQAGKVRLAKPDGSQIEIELSKLSAADRAYANEQAKAGASP